MDQHLSLRDVAALSAVFFIVAIITARHYLIRVSHEKLALYNIHYLPYFLPILMVAIWYVFYGGILRAISASVLYAPIVFDPAGHTGPYTVHERRGLRTIALPGCMILPTWE